MPATASWRELSDVQRESWRIVGPFLAAHLIANALVWAAYALGLTGMVMGNGACLAVEALNTGITDLHRTLGGAESLDRICQIFVPASLVNVMFAAILGAVVILARGIGVVATKYFLPLLIFALVPLSTLVHDPSSFAPSSLARDIRSGSWGAHIVFLIGAPLITNMLAALPLQKVQKRP